MQYKDIDFIVSNFREDAFSTDNNWRRFKTIVGLGSRRKGIAAAVAAGVIAITASSAILTYNKLHSRSNETVLEKEHPEVLIPAVEEPGKMVFEATKLSEVVETVEMEYGIKIGNIPSHSDEYLLTLRFEGTPDELIEAINEILGTHLTIEER